MIPSRDLGPGDMVYLREYGNPKRATVVHIRKDRRILLQLPGTKTRKLVPQSQVFRTAVEALATDVHLQEERVRAAEAELARIRRVYERAKALDEEGEPQETNGAGCISAC